MLSVTKDVPKGTILIFLIVVEGARPFRCPAVLLSGLMAEKRNFSSSKGNGDACYNREKKGQQSESNKDRFVVFYRSEKENAMKLNVKGLSHLGLRVTDLARAKRFYVDTLGCHVVREIEEAVLVNMYGVLIGLYGAAARTASDDRFDPFRVGLDHLALTVEDPATLEELKQEFDAAGVPNHGVEEDPETHDRYISFSDPDGIAWELYAIATHSDGL